MDARRTIGLALSGGGFRASLFHLGVLKRLHELKILDQVDYISCVSGGAVVGALYVHLKKTRGANFQFSDLERELLTFIKRNPRTLWLPVTIIRRILLWITPPSISPFIDRILRRISFDRSFNNLFGNYKLDSLLPKLEENGQADCPRLIINTTSLEIGQNFYFTPSYIGPRKDGALGIGSENPSRIGADQITIGTAVGASACFPVVFPPYEIPVNHEAIDDKTATTGLQLSGTRLVDGGVYDNQGFGVFMTEAFEKKERVDYLIVSDASKTLQPSANPLPQFIDVFKHLALLQRSHEITEERARWERFGLLLYKRQVRHLAQIAIFHTDTHRFESEPYTLPASATYKLARLRTDLDSFSDLEILALMYHGYSLVNHRIFNFCYDLLPEALRASNPILFPDLSATPPDKNYDRELVTWNKLAELISNVSDHIAPLLNWKSFAVQVQPSCPQRWRLTRMVLGQLERPWRPYLEEDNPCVPRNPSARHAAEAHIGHGAKRSLFWRGLQRLEARGGGWKILARVFKLALMLSILLAIEEILEFIILPSAQFLVHALHVVLNWMHLFVR